MLLSCLIGLPVLGVITVVCLNYLDKWNYVLKYIRYIIKSSLFIKLILLINFMMKLILFIAILWLLSYLNIFDDITYIEMKFDQIFQYKTITTYKTITVCRGVNMYKYKWFIVIFMFLGFIYLNIKNIILIIAAWVFVNCFLTNFWRKNFFFKKQNQVKKFISFLLFLKANPNNIIYYLIQLVLFIFIIRWPIRYAMIYLITPNSCLISYFLVILFSMPWIYYFSNIFMKFFTWKMRLIQKKTLTDDDWNLFNACVIEKVNIFNCIFYIFSYFIINKYLYALYPYFLILPFLVIFCYFSYLINKILAKTEKPPQKTDTVVFQASLGNPGSIVQLGLGSACLSAYTFLIKEGEIVIDENYKYMSSNRGEVKKYLSSEDYPEHVKNSKILKLVEAQKERIKDFGNNSGTNLSYSNEGIFTIKTDNNVKPYIFVAHGLVEYWTKDCLIPTHILTYFDKSSPMHLPSYYQSKYLPTNSIHGFSKEILNIDIGDYLYPNSKLIINTPVEYIDGHSGTMYKHIHLYYRNMEYLAKPLIQKNNMQDIAYFIKDKDIDVDAATAGLNMSNFIKNQIINEIIKVDPANNKLAFANNNIVNYYKGGDDSFQFRVDQGKSNIVRFNFKNLSELFSYEKEELKNRATKREYSQDKAKYLDSNKNYYLISGDGPYIKFTLFNSNSNSVYNEYESFSILHAINLKNFNFKDYPEVFPNLKDDYVISLPQSVYVVPEAGSYIKNLVSYLINKNILLSKDKEIFNQEKIRNEKLLEEIIKKNRKEIEQLELR